MRKKLSFLNNRFFLKLLDKLIAWADPKYRYKLRFFRRYFLNYEKINLIDVGSYGGFLDKFNKKNINKILSFDPIDQRNSKEKNIVVNSALWDSNTEINIYHTKGGGTDTVKHDTDLIKKIMPSLLKRHSAKNPEKFLDNIQILKTSRVQAKTLDEILKNDKNTWDFIKIDVQGAEKNVLLGAKNFLSSVTTLGLIIETYQKKFFIDQFDENEITDFLSSYGFVKVLIFPSHGSYSIQNEILYIKKNISSPKLNTILKTYGLLTHKDGIYQI
jgi:FkbM family methyltransferase